MADVSRKNVPPAVLKKSAAVSRVSYPCYKSFDEYTDVERLKSQDDDYLSGDIRRRRRRRRPRPREEDYFLSAFRLDSLGPRLPSAAETTWRR